MNAAFSIFNFQFSIYMSRTGHAEHAEAPNVIAWRYRRSAISVQEGTIHGLRARRDFGSWWLSSYGASVIVYL